jgi:hypothetical protein
MVSVSRYSTAPPTTGTAITRSIEGVLEAGLRAGPRSALRRHHRPTATSSARNSWVCQDVARRGQVTATDLDTGLLSELSLPNLTRRARRRLPERSFGLVHVRAVLMHIADRMAVLRRMASWLAPGGWDRHQASSGWYGAAVRPASGPCQRRAAMPGLDSQVTGDLKVEP